jgi:hypothetical protein
MLIAKKQKKKRRKVIDVEISDRVISEKPMTTKEEIFLPTEISKSKPNAEVIEGKNLLLKI